MSRGLGRMRLCRLEQDVTLLAKGQLDHAFRREVRGLQDHLLVANSGIVDAKTAALALTARPAVCRAKTGFDEQRQHADAGLESSARNFYRGKVFGDRAFF